VEENYLRMLQDVISMRGRKRLFEDDKGDMREKIKDFFKNNPYPKDNKVHEFAQSLGIEPDEFETHIYALLTDYLKIGKHQDVPDDKFDSNELDMGQKVEMEHTDNPEIARIIAKDHLTEIKNYYTRLKKMEDEAKVGKKD
jgi:hypothetical protein